MTRTFVGLLLAVVVAAGFVIGSVARSATPLPTNTAHSAPPILVVAGTPFGSAAGSSALVAALQRSTVLVIQPVGRSATGLSGADGLLRDVTTASASRGARGALVLVGRSDAGETPAQLVPAIGALLQRLEATVPADRIVVVGPTWPTADAPEAVRALRDTWKASTLVSSARFVDPIAEGWNVAERAHPTLMTALPTTAGVARYAQRLDASLQ